jgi:AraC-like DNA-binding protein
MKTAHSTHLQRDADYKQEARDKPQREFARLWRNSDLNDLELLHARFLTTSFAPHTHDTYAIGIVESGAESFAYRGKQHLAGAGALAVIHPGELHTGGPFGSEGWRYRALYPDASLITKTLAEMGCNANHLPFFGEAVIDDPALLQEFVAMHRRLEEDIPLLEREARLICALSMLIERYADPVQTLRPVKPEHHAVARIVDFLHDNLSDPIKLDELADLTQLSKYHLLRVFRNEMGLPPHAYLNQLRIERAKALLLTGAPPASVAAEVGFADQAHLTRLFKRTIGVTPGAVASDKDAD